MGHQIIKQPDGLYAIFSSGTDTWIGYDFTREELIGWYAERAAEDARKSTADLIGKVDEDPRKAYYQFAVTFAEANAHSKAAGGEVLPGPVDEDLYGELREEWASDD